MPDDEGRLEDMEPLEGVERLHDEEPTPADTIVETQLAPDEVNGYAAGAIACAVGSFLVPVVLAVAALILARASEIRREQQGNVAEGDARSANETLVWVSRIVAWANIVLACGFLAFLLLGIAARVVA